MTSRIDPQSFGRVAVLLGGTSSEREVSLNSGRNVLEALQQRGVDAQAVDGTAALVQALVAKRFDRVFNIMHGGDGENGVVQGLMDSFAIPYTGSGVLGSALSMDKIRTKQVWLSLGLPTPRYARLLPGEDVTESAHRLGLPVIVKPSCEGSSVGVKLLFDNDNFFFTIDNWSYGESVLVEEYISGREITVAVRPSCWHWARNLRSRAHRHAAARTSPDAPRPGPA